MTYEDKLIEIVNSNSNIMVLTAENRAAIRNLSGKVGSKFLDTGINEMTLVGVSAGLALRGIVPVTHAISAFLTMRSFEFIRTDVGYPNLPVKLVGSFAGFLSDANGPTHQALEDIALMRVIPNLNIFCPADNDDLIKGLEKVIKSPNPFYIRYNNRDTGFSHNEEFEIGKAEFFGEHGDISIIVYGALFFECFNTMKILQNNGLKVNVINLRTVKPADEKLIADSLNNNKLIVTVEDHFVTGGLNSIVSEIAVQKKITAEIMPIGFNNKWFKPLMFKDAIEYEGFSPEKLSDRILVNFRNIK